MRNDKSMLEVAYEILEKKNGAIPFVDLMNQVAEILGMSEEEKNARLGTFYTDLTLDGRFVALTDNNWDLRKNHTYDKVHIDYNEVYSEEEDSDDKDKEEESEDEESEKEVDEEEGEEEGNKNVPLDEDIASFDGQNQ